MAPFKQAVSCWLLRMSIFHLRTWWFVTPVTGERAEWLLFLGAARQCLWNLELGFCYFDRLFINRRVIVSHTVVSKVSWNASWVMHESTGLWNCLVGAWWYKFSITYIGLTLEKQLAEKSFSFNSVILLGPDLIHKFQIRAEERRGIQEVSLI